MKGGFSDRGNTSLVFERSLENLADFLEAQNESCTYPRPSTCAAINAEIFRSSDLDLADFKLDVDFCVARYGATFNELIEHEPFLADQRPMPRLKVGSGSLPPRHFGFNNGPVWQDNDKEYSVASRNKRPRLCNRIAKLRRRPGGIEAFSLRS